MPDDASPFRKLVRLLGIAVLGLAACGLAHAADFLFKNEIGLESLARYNSIVKAIPEAGELANNRSWVACLLLDHRFPARHMTLVITERIGAPATLADFASMSELLSAQA
jgi:hypothetical protein